jgi:hypothetical protein
MPFHSIASRVVSTSLLPAFFRSAGERQRPVAGRQTPPSSIDLQLHGRNFIAAQMGVKIELAQIRSIRYITVSGVQLQVKITMFHLIGVKIPALAAQ